MLTFIFCSCSKCSLVGEAEQAFFAMKHHGYLSDTSTFNAMISMYGKKGMIDLATDTYALLRKTGLNPDVVTYNCLMSMYGREGMYRKCEATLRECAAAGVTPDLVSYNTVIFAYRYFHVTCVLNGRSCCHGPLVFVCIEPRV